MKNTIANITGPLNLGQKARFQMRSFVKSRISLVLIAIACVGWAGTSPAKADDGQSVLYAKADATGAGGVEDAIANAMSAGPASITAEATILDYPSDPAGDMIVLREGSNGWTCFTDWPATPGNDPMCVDQVWVEFLGAWAVGEAPNVTSPGVGYMLAGGSAASNTDPFAMEPAAGEDWLTSPPHVMLLFPDSVDLSQFTTDHTSGEPWVMWGGTPYEHIMMPADLGEMEN